ncbi:MAG: hypothetical protein R2748_00735 [Bryobacterales bacterium]
MTNRDIELAERQGNTARVEQLRAIRTERFELLSRLAALPDDMMFFTQITMEAPRTRNSSSGCARARCAARWWASSR